jgi:hypothetical protein
MVLSLDIRAVKGYLNRYSLKLVVTAAWQFSGSVI